MGNEVRNIAKALSKVEEPWQPHRLASVNDYDVKVVKLEDEFVWHSHPDTDELFLVLRGRLTIQLRDQDVVLGPQDLYVIVPSIQRDHNTRSLVVVERCRRSQRIAFVRLRLDPKSAVGYCR